MTQCILACDTFDFNFWSLLSWEATVMCIFSSHRSHRFQNIFYFFCRPNITPEITMLVKDTTCFYTFCHSLTISTHVGGVTRAMCACIVRQDYTEAHFHAHGWTTPQRLFILCLLRRERCPKSEMSSQSLQCSSLWIFFHPLQFVMKSVLS